MQFEVGNKASGGLELVYIYHKGYKQEWEISTYSRSTVKQPEILFKNLNGYIASLQETEQDSLWDCYAEIFRIMNEVNNPARFNKLLKEQVQLIYQILKFDDLKAWIQTHGRINVPNDPTDNYSEMGGKLKRDLTYYADEYYDLAVLCVLLKPMLPIFGEYIRQMGNIKGTNFKEHNAFSLLSASNVIQLDAFQRLKRYVDANAANERNKSPAEYQKSSAIFEGLGTEELPDWLLSRAVVRRVVIQQEALDDSAVASVYHAIIQKLSSLDRAFKGRIDKKTLFKGKTEEDNLSVVENYKVKQEISDGDLAVLTTFTEDTLRMAHVVEPELEDELLQKCMTNIEQNKAIEIETHHIVLTQYVMSAALPPRGIPSLSMPALLRSMAVTQAILWHWGFIELAALMVAERSPEPSSAASSSSSRLNKQYIADFEQLYPHYQQVSKSQMTTRNVNVACIAIDDLSARLTSRDWICYGPKELTEALGLRNIPDTHLISAEIRIKLADLLFKIYERKNEIDPTLEAVKKPAL